MKDLSKHFQHAETVENDHKLRVKIMDMKALFKHLHIPMPLVPTFCIIYPYFLLK